MARNTDSVSNKHKIILINSWLSAIRINMHKAPKLDICCSAKLTFLTAYSLPSRHACTVA